MSDFYWTIKGGVKIKMFDEGDGSYSFPIRLATVDDPLPIAPTGTQDVEITNTPHVIIDTIPSVTGTVNIGNTPHVIIDDLPELTVSTLPAVNVNSMPNVNVASMPNVNVASMPNVTVSAMPDVNIANPVISTRTVTIAALGNTSTSVALSGAKRIYGILIPSGWTALATSISIEVSPDNSTWYGVTNTNGSDLSLSSVANRAIYSTIPLFNMTHVRIKSGTLGTPISVSTQQIITLLVA